MLELVPMQVVVTSGVPTIVFGSTVTGSDPGGGGALAVDMPNQNYRIVNPTYGPTVTLDLTQGAWFRITATNAVAFTVANPINVSSASGPEIQITIRNTSGGALGALTFGALFKTGGAWTQPANTFSRSIQFTFDGTNWIETGRSAADVSN